jgi:hypothetical protein
MVWRIVVMRILRRREGDLLAPPRDAETGMVALHLVAGLGMDARPRQTFAEVRLRVSAGARLAVVLLTAAIAGTIVRMHGEQVFATGVPLPELAVLAFGMVQALYFLTWEARYTPDHLTAPRWFFGSRTYRWRSLSAIVAEDAWFLTFRFDDGRVARVPKFIVGRAGLLEVAQHWLRHDERPSPPHARTARG